MDKKAKEYPKLNLKNNFEQFKIAESLVPGGVLGIRRPYNFVEGEYPIFFDNGKGGRVIDIDGNEYIDFLCAYGPIIIGYREEEIDNAVIEQIKNKGFCFSLTQVYQNKLAKKFQELIPCSEMTIFVKTGSDATTTAIRLARAYTGKTKIIRCGYHGWHDWCVEVKGGIPKKLYEDVFEFKYNQIDTLIELMEKYGNDTAAIIITPIGHPLGAKVEEPKNGFLEEVKSIAHKYRSVLIFDEIRTGFRVSLGGAQKIYNVTPDIAVFGKAVANGYSISAVTGKKEIMKMAEKEVFISSTFFPNSLSYVAALKTIEIIERENVIDNIMEKGKLFLNLVKLAIEKYPDTQAELSGIPQMPFITFKKDPDKIYKKKREDFYTQLIRRKVFLQPYHHGYIAYRHTIDDIKYAALAIEESLAYVSNKYK